MRTWRVLFLYDMCVGERASKWNVIRQMGNIICGVDRLTARVDFECAKLIKRHLPLDVALAERHIHESRSRTSEKYARSCAELANSHRAHTNINVFGRSEIDQACQLCRIVGACCHLKNVRAIRLCRTRLGSQPTWRRGAF